MPSMRKLFDGLSVLMNYVEDGDDEIVVFRRGAFWADGPAPGDLEEPDGEKLAKAGWGWNTYREKWEF